VLDTITTVLVALLGVQVIVKFAFFALPYRMSYAIQDSPWQ
jgi:hypothetical protein